ncbi:MAG: hypothetical protein GXY33_09790 [Phycisphaerae bacterium]|nr:hypothetical protein [Phycisphaerae bacterium]
MTRKTTISLTLLAMVLTNQPAAAEQTATQTAAKPAPRTIAVFGSSVASGERDSRGGYAARLAEALPRQWKLVNVSRGGDNTVSIQPRFDELLTAQPDYAIIGLSLANEGLAAADDDAECQRVFDQFHRGLCTLINRCRAANIQPVIGLCYANSDFSPEKYEYTRRMNLLINTWDVPGINFLGAVDDGHGHWVKACEADAGHPSDRGHEEMFHAIVPSLFDALAAGKPIPRFTTTDGYWRSDRSSATTPILAFQPTHPMRPFTVAVAFRTSAANAPIAQIRAAEKTVRLTVQSGKLVYHGLNAARLASTANIADGQWHQLALAHRYANGQTLLFLDGEPAGAIAESLTPQRFSLGIANAEPGQGTVDLRDWLIYRSALNPDEAAALHRRQLIHASLELYAPLHDAPFQQGKTPANLAQSLSEVRVVAE